MKDLGFSLAYNLATRLILLIISVFSVKLLTVAEYGELSYVLVLIATLAIVSLFGGGVAINRSFTIEKNSKNYNNSNKIFLSNVIISLFMSVLLFLGSMVFLKDFSNLIFVFLIFSLMSFNSIVEGALYGLGEYKKLAVNSIVVFAISVALSYFLIVEFRAIGALIALLAYRALLFLLNFSVIYKKRIIKYIPLKILFKDFVVLDSLKKISLPTFFSAILVAPVMMVLLKFLKEVPNGVNEIAYFSWVNQVYTVAVFFPSILTGFLISKMSGEIKDARIKLVQYSKYNFLFGVVLSIILLALKPLILGWAGVIYFEKSSMVYDMMLITICVYCLNAAYGSYWTSVNKAHLGLLVNFIWAFIVSLFGYFLIQNIKSSFALFMSLSIGYLIIFTIQTYVFIKR